MSERQNLVPTSDKTSPPKPWYRTFLPGAMQFETQNLKTMDNGQHQPHDVATTAATVEERDVESGVRETQPLNDKFHTTSATTTANPDKPQEESSSCNCRRLLGTLRRHLLVLLLIMALILGIALGACLRLRARPYSKRELMYIRFPGELLMNMLQLLILPLIVSSLVSGMTSLDSRASGRLGLRAVVYYLTTTLMAVVVGIVMVVSIRPGTRDQSQGQDTQDSQLTQVDPADTFLDLIRQMFPDNIVEATFQKTLTKIEERPVEPDSQRGTGNTTATGNVTTEMVPVLHDVDGINMLGLVVFSVAVGLAINHAGPQGSALKAVFQSLNDVTLVLVSVVIWYSPVGVLFLVAEEVVSMEDPVQTFQQLSLFAVTVVAGLAIHACLTLPLLFLAVCRRNPLPFMAGVLQAVVTALGTSSSSATLPVTMRNLEENNGVDPRIIGFVAPIGATINMDGTALYEAVAVIFIGQLEGYTMDFGNIVIICLTSTAAAVGAAGVPQAGLVTMVIVLTAVGFPTDRVGLLLALDWLLDRFRTAVNVLGDAYGAGIVHHLSLADLARMDEEDKMAAAEPASLEVKVDKMAATSGVEVKAAKAGPDLARRESNGQLLGQNTLQGHAETVHNERQ